VTRVVVTFDLRRIGHRMPRTRYQRGTLKASVPKRGNKPARKLPRGTFWGSWYRYARQVDGSEQRIKREKIITKDLARKYGFAADYEGPLNRTDAQRVLETLIAEESGVYIAPNRAATVAMVAQEYLALAQPNWGPHMVRTAGNLVQKHIINGKLAMRPIADVEEGELQAWLNGYVSTGASRSLLSNLLLHIRSVFKHARKKKIMTENPTEDLRAKSKKRVCERALSLDECQRLLAVVTGRDHLVLRIFIQLGLRPEEVFALRRNDVIGDQLRVDEALVEGKSAPVKTQASGAFVYVPPDLQIELSHWIECSEGEPTDWLFHPWKGIGRAGPLNLNNYRERILQPAALRAKVGVIDSGGRDKHGNPILKTDVDFRALRRTCATLFGDRAKDPKSTQAQLRHADPRITLQRYQKAVPESVKAAALAFEADLVSGSARKPVHPN
jgi:integrase